MNQWWVGVLFGSVLVPILWWLVIRLLNWLSAQAPISQLLHGMLDGEEPCQILLPDFRVELHPSAQPPNNWPLLRTTPPRLGGTVYGRGINIPSVWADCDGQAVARMLNLLGQAGKKTNIKITRFSEDDGNRNSHLISIGGQDLLAQNFYTEMDDVFYHMDCQEIYDSETGQTIGRPGPYGYGLILKATNPFKVDGHKGVAILVGGFGVLGTEAAAYYLQTHGRELGAKFGRKNFGVVVRASIATGPQSVQRIEELDKPVLTGWSRFASCLRRLLFRAW